MDLVEFFKSLHSQDGLKQLIQTGGLLVLMAMVFSETGLLVGFFLPGDSLLVVTGVVCSKMEAAGLEGMNIWMVNVALIIAVIAGDQMGYFLGYKAGPQIFKKDDSLLFKKKHAEEAHAFYLKHGGKAVIMARYVPILRTFVPFIAGVAKMPYKRYLIFSCIGGVLWISSLLWIGYHLGHTEYAEKLHHVILIVVAVSFLPVFWSLAQRFLFKKPLIS